LTNTKAIDKEIKSLKKTCTDVDCDNVSECWNDEKIELLKKDLSVRRKN
jgi:lipoate synthase